MGRAAAGDKEALGCLIDHYFHFANQVARGLVLDVDAAQDIVSDAIVTIVVKHEQLDPTRNFRGLVYTAVFNNAMTYFKKRGREDGRTRSLGDPDSRNDPADDAPSVEDTVVDKVEAASRRAKVERALALLSATDQDVIRVRYLSGETVSEAARSLGISEAAVKVRLHRAMRRLKEMLAHES